MGVGIRFSSGSHWEFDSTSPNPAIFLIEKMVRIGKLFVTKINYPNCTNYEGNKIIVSDFDPTTRTSIDPHFTSYSGIIARFEPTQAGWENAMMFAKSNLEQELIKKEVKANWTDKVKHEVITKEQQMTVLQSSDFKNLSSKNRHLLNRLSDFNSQIINLIGQLTLLRNEVIETINNPSGEPLKK